MSVVLVVSLLVESVTVLEVSEVEVVSLLVESPELVESDVESEDVSVSVESVESVEPLEPLESVESVESDGTQIHEGPLAEPSQTATSNEVLWSSLHASSGAVAQESRLSLPRSQKRIPIASEEQASGRSA